MTTTGLDFMYPPADPAGFAHAANIAGHTFVMRYLAAHGNPKIVTKAEVAAYRAAGLGIGLVFEQDQYRPRSGDVAGLTDGALARAQALDVSFPVGWPIFGAVDFDPLDSELPVIASYLYGGSFEVYGNAKTCAYMLKTGTCKHFWQHDWGGGTFGGRHVHQHGGTVTVEGISCDLNQEYDAGCCIWGLPTASILPEESDVLTFTDGGIHYACDANGNVYVFDAHGTPGGPPGAYKGGLQHHPKDASDWGTGVGRPNGSPFMFGPTPEGGYVITTRDAAGRFHPYVFPPSGLV